MKEFGDDLRAKGKAHASVVLTPSHGFFVRITPQQITEQTIVWYVCWPHYPADLLHGLQVWTQASMTTENLFINDGSYGQTIKAICESFPQLYTVPPLAFIIK